MHNQQHNKTSNKCAKQQDEANNNKKKQKRKGTKVKWKRLISFKNSMDQIGGAAKKENDHKTTEKSTQQKQIREVE